MEEKKSKISKLFDEYLSKMSPIKGNEDASKLYNELTRGKTSYMKLNRLATSFFDMTWINAIEDCLFDLGDIVKNPREVTKAEPVLVPVELARKTSSESVRHLASHTQYIKSVSDEGDVVPNKVVTIANEEDFHTYENRFIATLIRRLVLFIEKRYEFIQSFPPFSNEEILYFKNHSIVNGAEVEIETKIKIQSESDTSIAEISDKYIERIKDIREYVLYYYTSQFMHIMKNDRDVRNPIIMTNILRKNPKYRKCYELYRFIEKYQQLGVSYKVDENVTMLTGKEIEELNTVMFTNYLAAQDSDRTKKLKSTSKQYKPKILTSLDDEQFTYGELLKGPIEFLRIDEDYQNYLDSKVKKDLPVHPTKVEREYYEEEYQYRKDRKEEKAQLEKLKKRKSKETLENEKRIRKIIADREREEELRRQAEEEAARRAEEEKLNAVREEIIAAAKGDMPTEEAPVTEEASTEAAAEETPATEETSEAETTSEEENKEVTADDFSDVTPRTDVVYEDIYSTEEEKSTDEEVEETTPIVKEESLSVMDDGLDVFESKETTPKKRVSIEDFKGIEPRSEEEYDDVYADAPSYEDDSIEVDSHIIEYTNELRKPVDLNDISDIFVSEESSKEAVIIKKDNASEEPIRYQKVGGTKRKHKKAQKEEIPVEEPVVEESKAEETAIEEVTEETPIVEETTAIEESSDVSEGPKEEPATKEAIIVKKESGSDEPIRYQKIGGTKRKHKKTTREEPVVVEEAPVEEEVLVESEEPKEETPVIEETPVEVIEETAEETPAKEESKAKESIIVKRDGGYEEPIRYQKIGGTKRKHQKVRREETSEAPTEEVKEETPVTKKPVKEAVIVKKENGNEEPIRYQKIGGTKRKHKKVTNEETIVTKEPKEEPKKVKEAVIVKKDNGYEEPIRYQKIGGTKRKHKKVTRESERFVIKTKEGYYVSEGNYSNNENEALIFDDVNKANEVNNKVGGEVVKL